MNTVPYIYSLLTVPVCRKILKYRNVFGISVLKELLKLSKMEPLAPVRMGLVILESSNSSLARAPLRDLLDEILAVGCPIEKVAESPFMTSSSDLIDEQ